MTHYNHLEPRLGGPTFPESLAVAMLFIILDVHNVRVRTG